MVPTDRQFIHAGVERMPRGHKRQHTAANHAIVGKQADTAAFGKTTGPAAHRCQYQPAVVFDRPYAGTNGVQVCRDGAVRAALLAFEGGAQGAAARQLEGDTQFIETFGNVAHDGVGKARRAGNGEHFQQDPLQVLKVGFREGAIHENS